MMSFSCGRNELLSGLVLASLMGLVSLGGGMARAEQWPSIVDPSDFAYPVAWLTTGPARDRMQYSFLRNRMLKTGFENVTAAGLKSAQQDYESARKLCGDDPRLDHAWGLVLWTHGQTHAALSQFESAARLKGPSVPFLPAAQAAACGSLATGQDERGLKLLVALATVIGKTTEGYPTLAQKRDAAFVLGRTIGYLEGPGRSDQRDPEAKHAAEAVVAALPTELRKEFDLGKSQVASRQEELKALAARPTDELMDEFTAAKSQLEADLVAKNQTIQQSSHEIAKTHGTHRKNYRELTTKINAIPSQMASLQCRAARVSQAAAELSTPRERTGRRDTGRTRTVTEYERRSNGTYKQVTRSVPEYETYSIPESCGERSARLSQLNMVLAEMKQIQQQAARLRKDAEELPAKRLAAIEQNADVAPVLRRELNDTHRDKRELAQQLQQLERSHRSLVGMKANADSLIAYVPWDLDCEREALTKSYLVTARSK